MGRRAGFVVTTQSDRAQPQTPDLVRRRFVAETPNALWVADMTYVPAGAGLSYLAVVIEAWSRRVMGWANGGCMTAGAGAGGVEHGARTAASQRRHLSQRPGLPVHELGLRQPLRLDGRAPVDGQRGTR